MKYRLTTFPFLGSYFHRFFNKIERQKGFKNSQDYWINRYDIGVNSVLGSYAILAEFKEKTLNKFVLENEIETVAEYGCGDGNQLRYANYPNYIGFDISPRAIRLCQNIFKEDKNKEFIVLAENLVVNKTFELTLSLDVIFHLTEDKVFDDYMKRLFDSSDRFVCIYSSNTENPDFQAPPHVRHRKFSNWIENNRSNWRLFKEIANPYPYNGNDEISSFANFYFFKKS